MEKSKHEDILFKIFANVNDWLKFAEAKNAMILAFNAASIYGITKTMDLDCIKESKPLMGYLFVVIIILVFSCICSLVSFAPRVKILNGGLFGPSDFSNVLFFEYLKTKSNIEIIKEVTGIVDESTFSKIDKDIAEQIKQNSIIASRKYSYFTISVWLTISAYVTPLVAGIYFLYTYFNEQ